jgi:hypothetical protein
MRRLIFVGLAVAVSACSNPGMVVQNQDPTWYKDALPIVQAHCQNCHKEGGIAPFALETYDDAIAHLVDISKQVTAGTMPPWLPEHDDQCESLQGVRALSDADKNMLLSWTDGYAKEGDPADAPPPPAGQQGLAHVDMKLDAGYDYTPNASLKDDYHCSILDPGLTTDRILVGYDVAPGDRREVHHVLLYPADAATATALDPGLAAKPPTTPTGWTCFGDSGISSATPAGGWAPGAGAVNYPATTGIRIKKGQVIVMQVHYNLANGAYPDRTAVSLSFADSVDHEGMMLPFLDNKFSIPAGAADYSTTKQYQVPVGGTLWGVFPHMHTLGTTISVKMNDSCLINIPRWDFHWQQQYFVDAADGVPFNAGDTATLECHWNNSAGTTAVTWGEQTTDEMCLNFFFLSL